MAAQSSALSFSSLKQNLIIRVHNLATGQLLGMALIWGLCAVAVSCGYPFLMSPLGGEPRLVLSCGGSAVVVGCSMAHGFCCLSDLKQLPGSLTAPPFGTLIQTPMESSQL